MIKPFYISESDRIQPTDYPEIRHPSFPGDWVVFPVNDPRPPRLPVNREADYLRPPALPVIRRASYKFIDAVTGHTVTGVTLKPVATRLKGLGYSVYSATGKGIFSNTEAGRTYTAKAPGYDPITFRPVANKTITVKLRKSVPKNAQYRFVDASTGRIIPGVILKPFGIKPFSPVANGLKGLGAPTYSAGVYTFPQSDFGKTYIVTAPDYNTTSIRVSRYNGVVTVKLIRKTIVKFIDAQTNQAIRGITITSGRLAGLLGLGGTYTNKSGLFTFTFRPNESRLIYTVNAPGYEEKQIVIFPGSRVNVVKMQRKKVSNPKNPPVASGDDNRARRLRLAKAKAKARLRKIKLLAI